MGYGKSEKNDKPESVITVNGVLSFFFFLAFALAIASVVAKSAPMDDASSMSCKKLYSMQDLEKNSKVFKEELTTRCSKPVLAQLAELKKAYASTTDTDMKNELVKKMIKLENELEVK